MMFYLRQCQCGSFGAILADGVFDLISVLREQRRIHGVDSNI